MLVVLCEKGSFSQKNSPFLSKHCNERETLGDMRHIHNATAETDKENNVSVFGEYIPR